MDYVDPPSGSVIANFEGVALNTTTALRCNVSNQAGTQISTQWNIENFGGNPVLQPINVALGLVDIGGDLRPGSTTDTFLNRITVLNFTSDLDNAILYCGTGVDPRLANFTIKIYRKISLNCLAIHISLANFVWHTELVSIPEPSHVHVT